MTGDSTNPQEFGTLDEFDDSMPAPEVASDDDTEDGEDGQATPETPVGHRLRGIPPGTLMSAVGVLSAAYNGR